MTVRSEYNGCNAAPVFLNCTFQAFRIIIFNVLNMALPLVRNSRPMGLAPRMGPVIGTPGCQYDPFPGIHPGNRNSIGGDIGTVFPEHAPITVMNGSSHFFCQG